MFSKSRSFVFPHAVVLLLIAGLLPVRQSAVYAQTTTPGPQPYRATERADFYGSGLNNAETSAANNATEQQTTGHLHFASAVRSSDPIHMMPLWREPAEPMDTVPESGVPRPKSGDTTSGAGTYPTLPIFINDAEIKIRAAAIYDSTRLNPAAQGHFYTSAIPVKGNAFFGSGGRSTVQGSGSAIGLGFGVPDSDISAHVTLEAISASSDSTQFGLSQAYLKWKQLIFGTADSAFTDQTVYPESYDQAGPSGWPHILSSIGQPQIRYMFLLPEKDTGFVGNLSVEMPTADVNLSGRDGYSTFSRYPDCVSTLRYQSADLVADDCDKNFYFKEYWHIQFGAVVRDLGVEGNGTTVSAVRNTATGWGTQLSGKCNVFANSRPDQCLSDYLMFSLTWGEGIGRYFADLHNVSPVNDAAYNPVTNTLTPLPIFTYLAGYEHDWSNNLRSTAAYSHIDLDSISIPGGTTPYHQGDYLSINLVFHQEPCLPNNVAKTSYSRHFFLGGLEYLFGQREDLAGNFGSDQRVLLFFGGSK
jgi:hypothetical protein